MRTLLAGAGGLVRWGMWRRPDRQGDVRTEGRARRARLVMLTALGLSVVSGSAARFQTGSGPPPRDTVPKRAALATLRGRVLSADAGAPLRGATVKVFSAEANEHRVVTTDLEGRYEVTDLPAARYVLTASKEGYLTLQFGQREPRQSGKAIELSGEVRKGVDFRLPREAVIAGRVVDEFGDPKSNVIVVGMLMRFVQGRVSMIPTGRSSVTNDLGEFRLSGLTPGRYCVVATARNDISGAVAVSNRRVGYAPTFYPGTADPARAEPVTLDIGELLVGLTLPLAQTSMADIFGLITDSRGEPARRSTLMLQNTDVAVQVPNHGVRTMFDGSFRIVGVPQGRYTVIVTANVGRNAETEVASVPVAVGDEDVSDLRIVTGRPAVVTGTVIFEPAAPPELDRQKVAVIATPAGGERGPSSASVGRLENDSSFTLTGLFGSRVMAVQGLPAGWVMKAAFVNGVDVADTAIDFVANQVLSDVQLIVTDRAPVLNGSVVQSNGSVTADCSVIIFAEDRDKWSPWSRYFKVVQPTGRDGRFVVRGLPAGRYLAAAVAYVDFGEVHDSDFLEALSAKAASFQLKDEETKTIQLSVAPSQ